MSYNMELARKITNSVLCELCDRSGIGNELESMRIEDYNELIDTLTDIVKDQLYEADENGR